MLELVEANWPLFLVALLIGIAVAWLVFKASRRTRVETTKGDVLDEGAERSRRNQALIDAPPVAADLSNAANLQKFAHVDDAMTDAEAGPSAQSARSVGAVQEAAEGTDDLTRIKGVGPKLAALLNSLGIETFQQVAEWSEADIDRIDSQLGRFEGRIRRDSWVEQAKLLSAGEDAAFEAKFGKL
jgi:predicted flap endonuclease-1-like 5' DNA nuclease